MFTKATFVAALEFALVAGLSAFAGSLAIVNGQPTAKGVIAGAIAAGIAAIYAFTKSFGAVQAAVPAAPAAPVAPQTVTVIPTPPLPPPA